MFIQTSVKHVRQTVSLEHTTLNNLIKLCLCQFQYICLPFVGCLMYVNKKRFIPIKWGKIRLIFTCRHVNTFGHVRDSKIEPFFCLFISYSNFRFVFFISMIYCINQTLWMLRNWNILRCLWHIIHNTNSKHTQKRDIDMAPNQRK